jgi:hypothetical protein
MEKRIAENERLRAKEDLNKRGDDAFSTVIMPNYKRDARLKVDKEFNPPPDTLFIPLGWDEDATTKRKHYRQYYNDELENNKEIFAKKSPFDSFSLIRGQSRGASSSMFSKKPTDDSG